MEKTNMKGGLGRMITRNELARLVMGTIFLVKGYLVGLLNFYLTIWNEQAGLKNCCGCVEIAARNSELQGL